MSQQPDTAERLRADADRFPRLPGVYLMKDAAGEVIYIGKARDLRARVKSYFAGRDSRSQIEFLMRRVSILEKIVTGNEEQAFILERDLITKYKPRYNIRLKDDKAYLSVRVDPDGQWPKLELVRRVEDDGARYFGPYTSSYELRKLLETIKRAVPLRSCTDTVLYNRQRPCLEYQIKRCAGPCCLPVDREQYMAWVKQAIALLEGRTDSLIRELEAAMERAAEETRFEEAASLRDRIAVLQGAKKAAPLGVNTGGNQDAFAIHRDEGLATISVLRVRLGRIADSRNFALSDVVVSDEDLLESALSQLYEGGEELPDEIIIPFEPENMPMIRLALKERSGKAIEYTVPQKGLKFRLLELARVNARQHYSSTFEAEARNTAVIKELAKLLKLKQMPRRVECLDISNFQGSEIVGAIVAFFDGLPDKSAYRKFRISAQGKPDDFAAIHEVVTRRLKRGSAEGDLPDLLIIDGGPGQLSSALAARDALKLELEIVSLAKMRTESNMLSTEINRSPERVYTPRSSEPIPLDPHAAVTHFLQRARDEAHRFVIGYHRQSRGKSSIQSVLDTIPGIGPDRKARLLRAFGSVANMRGVDERELARAGRMSVLLARKVLDALGGSDR